MSRNGDLDLAALGDLLGGLAAGDANARLLAGRLLSSTAVRSALGTVLGEGGAVGTGQLSVGALAALLGLAGTGAAADTAPAPRPAAAFERHRDIAYRTGPGADKDRHRLDVFRPKGKTGCPVVLFVHGGKWEWGDKNLYAGLGEAFARDGVVTVICNYRLSPKVQHPGHVEDVAAAFAWVHEHIGEYGGDKNRLFVSGHSAGGHLVSLLATDPCYLKAVGLSPAAIKGVVSISGVYQIVHTEAVFHPAFGKDEAVCLKASPLTHAGGKHPPFLLAYADDDYRYLDQMAKNMHAALRKAESPCDLVVCEKRNHLSIVVNLVEPADPLRQKFLAFVTGK
jgi:acetyl esterase/lipase